MGREVYTTALGLERAAAQLARALSLTFEERRSVLDGDYFRAEGRSAAGGAGADCGAGAEGGGDPAVIEIRVNYTENDELVHPELPAGVFVTVDGGEGGALRATLAGLAYLRPVAPSAGG